MVVSSVYCGQCAGNEMQNTQLACCGPCVSEQKIAKVVHDIKLVKNSRETIGSVCKRISNGRKPPLCCGLFCRHHLPELK